MDGIFPPQDGNVGQNPWLIRLSNNKLCERIPDTGETYRGEPVTYNCSDSTVVLGDVDTSGDVYKVTNATLKQKEEGTIYLDSTKNMAVKIVYKHDY